MGAYLQLNVLPDKRCLNLPILLFMCQTLIQISSSWEKIIREFHLRNYHHKRELNSTLLSSNFSRSRHIFLKTILLKFHTQIYSLNIYHANITNVHLGKLSLHGKEVPTGSIYLCHSTNSVYEFTSKHTFYFSVSLCPSRTTLRQSLFKMFLHIYVSLRCCSPDNVQIYSWNLFSTCVCVLWNKLVSSRCASCPFFLPFFLLCSSDSFCCAYNRILSHLFMCRHRYRGVWLYMRRCWWNYNNFWLCCVRLSLTEKLWYRPQYNNHQNTHTHERQKLCDITMGKYYMWMHRQTHTHTYTQLVESTNSHWLALSYPETHKHTIFSHSKGSC